MGDVRSASGLAAGGSGAGGNGAGGAATGGGANTDANAPLPAGAEPPKQADGAPATASGAPKPNRGEASTGLSSIVQFQARLDHDSKGSINQLGALGGYECGRAQAVTTTIILIVKL